MCRITLSQVNEYLRQLGRPPVEVDQKITRQKPEFDSREEREYRDHLELLRIARKIERYEHWPKKLILADRTTYTPDFLVQVNGQVEFHEVKGRKKNRYYCRPASKVKIKVAARLFPAYTFVIVWPARGGGWDREVVKGLD
jgi:hypothetical protein